MLSHETSIRLAALRLPLVVGVVFIHSFATTVGFAGYTLGTDDGSRLTDFLRNLVSREIAPAAVPLFFLVSGYLFFAGFEFSWQGYAAKLHSRLHTLLVPFLFWNLATLGAIAIAQRVPATAQYFSGTNAPVAAYSLVDCLSAVFGVGRAPIAYQFWYVRDLMLLVLLTPAIWLLTRYIRHWYLVVLLVLWLLQQWPLQSPSVDATLFFCAGSVLAITHKDVFALDIVGRWAGAGYIVLVAVTATMAPTPTWDYLHRIVVLVGMVVALYFTKLALRPPSAARPFQALAGLSFFVFAAHEPLLTIVRKLAYKLVEPQSSYTVLMLYFLVPIVVIGMTIGVYRALRKVVPTFTRVITGGR